MGSVVFTDSYQISNYGYYTQNVRVNFSESYNSTTKKNTITLTSVEMLSDYAAGTSPVYGVVKFNGTAVKTMNGGSNQVNLANSYSVVSGSSGSYIDLNNDATSFTITLAEGNGGYFGAYVKTGTKPYRMFGVGTPANKTATVTAHYIVSYNANSGTGAPASQTKTYDVPLTLTTTKPSKATTTDATYTVTYNYHNGSSNTTATAAKKTAYAFSKWNTKSDGTGTNYSSGGTYSANAAATLYAQYTSSTSTAAVTLPTPTKTGYSFNGWYTAETGGTKVGNGGASYTPTATITLHAQWTALASTIATISSSVATQGNLALTVTRMSSAYYHKATFKIDGTTMATSSAFATSLSYTIPRSWFTSYSSATSKTVDVSVQTYTTSACTTTVGSPATSSFTMTADSGMKPTVSSGWAAFAYDNTGTAASGIAGYVKGYSKAKVTFDPSKIILNANSPGATIASYAVTCLGSTDSSSPYYTPTLTGTSVTATCKVTDSRGRYATQDFSISVMDYTKPTLSGITVFRCNSVGTADEDGANISVKATKNFSSLNGLNSCTLTAAIAPSGGSYGAATTLTSGTASVLGGNALSPDTSYTVKIIATDSLSNSATYYYTIPTRKWAMKFRTDGSGVAFGKAAEADNVFEVNPTWSVKAGNVHIEKDSGDVYCYAKRTDTSVQARMGVGSGGANHGIWTDGYYDGSFHSSGKWMIYRDNAGDVIVNGRAADNVLKSGDTMSGNLNVQKTEGCWVAAGSSNYGTNVSLTIANPNHGVYSQGYYDGSAFHSDPKWMIYRNSSGGTIVNGTSTDDFNLQQGTAIPNNSDLNNYTTPGCYYVLSSTEAATMTNGPITDTGYKLVVMVGSIANRRHQIAIRQSSNQMYVRNYSGSVWSAWERVITASQVKTFNLSGQKTFAAANTWEYSGVSVSIPAGAIYGVWALNAYQHPRPTGTAISKASSNINLWDLIAISESQPMIATATGYTPSAVTFYVWGRCNAAGDNPVYLNGWYYVV